MDFVVLAIYFKAILLGIVEGLTEFIPVSSTAHLILFSQLIDFNVIKNNVFEIAIQIGGILAIFLIYFQKISNLVLKVNEKQNQIFLQNIFIAFLPAIIIGFIAHDFIKLYLFSNFVIAISLIIGGILIIIIENFHDKFHINKIENMQKKHALLIGLCQCLAMIPGVSRSGATIMSGILFGVNRKIATEFSFFLALPTIGSACAYDLLKNYQQINFNDFEIILIGIISSFIASILVIKWLLKYISSHSFVGFGYYRILLGLTILFLAI